MKAVIVAAGKSTRLYPLTQDTPKPLLEVEGKTIIERSISNLQQNGIRQIGVVVGYLKEKMAKALENKATLIENPSYDSTNDMASLYCAKDFVRNEDFLYLHGDLIYHSDILKICLEVPKNAVLAVEKKQCDEEDMKVKVKNGLVIESSKQIPLSEAYGEWIGLAKFSKTGARLLFDEIGAILRKDRFNDAYDTYAFTVLARKGYKIDICHTNGLPWVEIDFVEELEKARRMEWNNSV